MCLFKYGFDSTCILYHFFIYNTHPHEIPNSRILELYHEFGLNEKFKSVSDAYHKIKKDRNIK